MCPVSPTLLRFACGQAHRHLCPESPSAISSKSWNGKSAPKWVQHVSIQGFHFFLARPDQDKGKPEIDRK